MISLRPTPILLYPFGHIVELAPQTAGYGGAHKLRME